MQLSVLTVAAHVNWAKERKKIEGRNKGEKIHKWRVKSENGEENKAWLKKIGYLINRF